MGASSNGGVRWRGAALALVAAGALVLLGRVLLAGSNRVDGLREDHQAGAASPSGVEISGAEADVAPRAGGRETAAVRAALPGGGRAGSEGASASPLSTLVDVFLVRPDGAPFVESAAQGGRRRRGSLRGTGVALVVVQEGAELDRTAVELRATGSRRMLSDPRWYCSFPRPSGPATVEVRFGTAVVDSAVLGADQASVTLTLSDAELERRACIVTGIAPRAADSGLALCLLRADTDAAGGAGSGGHASKATAQPVWDGAHFRFEGVAPGRVEVLLRPDLSWVEREARRAAQRGGNVSSGSSRGPGSARLAPEEFDGRVRVFARAALSAAAVSLELVAGETRDLGTLRAERTGGVVIRGEPPLGDERGIFRGVWTAVPLAPGARPAVGAWSDGARLFLAGLPLGRAELLIEGPLGQAIVAAEIRTLEGEAPEVSIDPALFGASVLKVPPGATLWTEGGAPVPLGGLGGAGSERWRGASTVPPGRYVLEVDGQRRAVEVPPDAFIDARLDPPLALPPGG